MGKSGGVFSTIARLFVPLAIISISILFLTDLKEDGKIAQSSGEESPLYGLFAGTIDSQPSPEARAALSLKLDRIHMSFMKATEEDSEGVDVKSIITDTYDKAVADWRYLEAAEVGLKTIAVLFGLKSPGYLASEREFDGLCAEYGLSPLIATLRNAALFFLVVIAAEILLTFLSKGKGSYVVKILDNEHVNSILIRLAVLGLALDFADLFYPWIAVVPAVRGIVAFQSTLTGSLTMLFLQGVLAIDIWRKTTKAAIYGRHPELRTPAAVNIVFLIIVLFMALQMVETGRWAMRLYQFERVYPAQAVISLMIPLIVILTFQFIFLVSFGWTASRQMTEVEYAKKVLNKKLTDSDIRDCFGTIRRFNTATYFACSSYVLAVTDLLDVFYKRLGMLVGHNFGELIDIDDKPRNFDYLHLVRGAVMTSVLISAVYIVLLLEYSSPSSRALRFFLGSATFILLLPFWKRLIRGPVASLAMMAAVFFVYFFTPWFLLNRGIELTSGFPVEPVLKGMSIIGAIACVAVYATLMPDIDAPEKLTVRHFIVESAIAMLMFCAIGAVAALAFKSAFPPEWEIGMFLYTGIAVIVVCAMRSDLQTRLRCACEQWEVGIPERIDELRDKHPLLWRLGSWKNGKR